jgi:Holliday junction resolvase RusA-like endonuclease
VDAVTVIRLEVVGVPQPQGSKTPMRNQHTGKIAMIEGRGPEAQQAFKSWRAATADVARAWLAAHPAPPLDEPLKITIAFRFAPVKSDPYRTLHATMPDVDKLSRAVLDALVSGGLLADDARVCRLTAEKRYAGEGESVGASIEVVPLGGMERSQRELRKKLAAVRRKGGV